MKAASGERFKKLSGIVAKEYEKKGDSPTKAKEIGAAVAAKEGRAKYGKKGMEKLSKKGREDAQGRRY